MSPNGIYTAYFTGEFGTSIGVFLILDGVISGGDLAGGIYDGQFEILSGKAVGIVSFRTLEGGLTITGASNDLPISYETKIELALPLDEPDYHEIDTMNGPVNVRFEKVRDLVR